MPVSGTGTVVRGLGGPRGFGEQEVARSDDSSVQLSLGAVFGGGLNYFGTRYAADQLWLNTNGTVTFGARLSAYPTATNSALNRDMIAPFWADVDTRLDGEGDESGGIWVDVDAGAGVVTLTWEAVGVYRRRADTPNTFQLQLFERGHGNFDIVFRYDTIGWTIGTGEGDVGARAGFYGVGAAPLLIEARDGYDVLGDLAQRPGPSGVRGLWVYEMRSGAVTNVVPAGQQISGSATGDVLEGGGGADTLQGGDGDDTLAGGAGDDSIAGGFGADTLIGGTGNDTLTGSAFGDLIFGGDGNDFINGGFGSDLINGGFGADEFYHLGIADHGSDWIQDFSHRQGDFLSFGNNAARPEQFQVNYDFKARAGSADIAEAFVIYKPTGQILWALVDGESARSINLQIGGDVFDLIS